MRQAELVVPQEPKWVITLHELVYSKNGDIYDNDLTIHWCDTINTLFRGKVLSSSQATTIEAFNTRYEGIINKCLRNLGKDAVSLGLNELFKEYQGID